MQADQSRSSSTQRTITEPLLEGFLQGESTAARRLLARLGRGLRDAVRFHPLYEVLEGRFSEDDVLGELWCSLLERRSLRSFRDRGRGSLRAYLRACVERVMIDLLRRHSAKRRGEGRFLQSLDATVSTNMVAHQVPAPGSGPSTQVRIDDWIECCRRGLPPREALVWQLRLTQGMDFAEVARHLSTTPAGARGLFHRAVRRLEEKGLLGEAG